MPDTQLVARYHDALSHHQASLDELSSLSRQLAVATLAEVLPGTSVIEALGQLDGVHAVHVEPADDAFHSFRLDLDEGADVGESAARLVTERGWRLRELRRDDRSLEQVFRELTESQVTA